MVRYPVILLLLIIAPTLSVSENTREGFSHANTARLKPLQTGLLQTSFKHLIYAPRPTYKPLVLPALTEAIEARDQSRAKLEVERLTRALKRAAAAIEGV